MARQDHLGTVYGLVDDDETHSISYSYDPYGNALAVSGAVHDSANRNVFRYTGRESTWSNNAKPTGDWANSVTDVYHYRSREYLPAIGQFNRLDDYRAQRNENLFGYVEGDSVNHSDPSGNFRYQAGGSGGYDGVGREMGCYGRHGEGEPLFFYINFIYVWFGASAAEHALAETEQEADEVDDYPKKGENYYLDLGTNLGLITGGTTGAVGGTWFGVKVFAPAFGLSPLYCGVGWCALGTYVLGKAGQGYWEHGLDYFKIPEGTFSGIDIPVGPPPSGGRAGGGRAYWINQGS